MLWYDEENGLPRKEEPAMKLHREKELIFLSCMLLAGAIVVISIPQILRLLHP